MSDAQRTHDLDALGERAQQLLCEKRPAEAAQALRELIPWLDAESPQDLHGRGDARRLLGSALRESGDLTGSTAALEDAIRILRDATGPPAQQLLLAISLRSIAFNYEASGQPDSASSARRQSLDLAGELLASAPDQAATLFITIAEELLAAGREDWQAPVADLRQRPQTLAIAPALRVLLALHKYWLSRDPDAARSIVKEAHGRISGLDAGMLSSNFALVHNVAIAALYSKAVDVARDITERLARVVDPKTPDDRYAVRRLQALVAFQSGPGQPAIDRAREAYDFARSLFGDEDARTRLSQREVADALAAAEKTDDAIDVYSHVLQVEQRIGKDPLITADVAYALGRLLDDKSRFPDACRVHMIGFSLRNQVLGARHPETNRSRYEVAELNRVLGRVDEAELFYRQALDVEVDLHGPETELGARIRNNLGDVYTMVGRYTIARTSIEQALAIRTKLSGGDSERVWRSRQSLAILANRSGNAGVAVTLARAAIAHDDLATDHPVWWVVLGTGLVQQGQHSEAEALFQQFFESLPIEDIGGAIALDVYFEMVEGLATCRVARQDWLAAVEVLRAVKNVVRDHLPSVVQQSSELQVTQFARAVLNLQSLWLWSLSRIAAPAPEQLAAALELLQLTKGVRTRYLRWRQPGVGNVESILRPDVDELLKKLLAEMRELQDQLTAALLTKDDSDDAAEPLSIVGTRATLRDLERRLASGISDSELEIEEELSLSKQTLPDGAVVIEIVVVRDVMMERRGGSAPAHRYAAFVVGLSAPAAIRLVDLGLCDEIDHAVAEMRESLVAEAWTDDARPPAWRRLSRFLGAKILKPLWAEISAAKHLLIAPDGGLGALPFEILSAPDGAYLLDKADVSYLMRLGELARDRQVFVKGGAPLVMAGPDFDLPAAFAGGSSLASGPDRLLQRSLGGAVHFQELSGSRDEGNAVAALLGVDGMVGVWALGPELLRAQSPEIIHLSTHGFNLPFKDAEKMSASLAAPLGNALDRRVVLEDAMQRSGLAMSGANAVLEGREIPPEAGTGTIVAAEIQQLNLQRTDMVVLSACRSGLGDLTIGDGAHGLRRAFLAAGVRSVISALWDVPDVSSQALVTHFYKRLLDKATRLEALADARAAVRADHPRDPVHWAGFVLDGHFGALARFSPLSDLKIAQVSWKEWIKSKDDREGITRLAKRIASGPNSEPEVLTSAVTLRRAAARTDLDEESRLFVLSGLGDLANRLGDNSAAINYFQQILRLKSLSAEDLVRVSYNIAKTCHQIGHLNEAIAAYTDVLSLSPQIDVKARVLVNRGVAYFQLGQFEHAASELTAVIDDRNTPADQLFMARMNRANALSKSDPTRAIADLEAAMASGQANESQMLRMRILRAQLWVATGDGRALGEIEDLKRDERLSDEMKGLIERLRAKL
ncbi:MAG: Kinesin light chain-like protein [Nitrospira sp.]